MLLKPLVYLYWAKIFASWTLDPAARVLNTASQTSVITFAGERELRHQACMAELVV